MEKPDYEYVGPVLSDEDVNYLKQLDNDFLNGFDPDDNSTNFTEEDYANLQRNLILFKEGNREATEYIIAAFHRVIHAYTHFIVLHKLPYIKYYDKLGNERFKINPSILSFIKLFGGRTKEEENKPWAKKDTSAIKDSCEYIYSLFSKFEYGDIYNELVLALLNMANKYKIITDKNDPKYKRNGTFHVYVKKCFHFEAFHFLKKLCNDPLMNFNILSISGDTVDFEDDQLPQDNTILVDEKALNNYNMIIEYVDRQLALQDKNYLILKEDRNLDLTSDDIFNFNWINGTVCDSIFKTLSSYERELIVLSYIKNQTEDTLANLFGYSRSTIGSHKRKAIEKIKKEIEKIKNAS